MSIELFSHLHRVSLAHLPTPLEAMPRLSQALGGPQLFVKRDDQTGLAGGGNKTRKLEFVLQEMGREVNTIGSKASDVTVSRHVVEIKSTLEKVRELIQNVE